ncbi:ParB/RepB/Spo0J family partition protein [Paraburkholderia tropica]|uniref:ParB/RepB/Spo0J family partition protein n=1 Tax=Paraburkholderia tropica TaxID=92647 RepID=UPI002AAF5821|nr:plasmid partitioning protein RepB C-terminal domain-containing protein [Paraburkholderia tropica]
MNDRIEKFVATLPRSDKITLLSADRLRVLNPRVRNQYFFSQLVENIASVGLKRPITVAFGGRDAEGEWHEVLCGQGRLEALRALGETMIPCCVVEASAADRHLITLAENLARRQHRAFELLGKLQELRDKGYSSEEIGRKTNLESSYVSGILMLLEKGEQKLIQAVERRSMPLWLAVEVARLPSAEVQAAMLAAYEGGTLNGDQLLRVRRILSKREASGKKLTTRSSTRDKPTPQKLLRTYQNEARKQRMIVQNANIQQQRLLLIVSALKKFLADEHFRTLLRAEDIRDIPEAVATRLPPELMP